MEQAEITEEKLPQSTPPSSAKVKGRSPNIPREREIAPALSPRVDGSLIAKITSKTPPQRAASLRLTEDGRKLLEATEYRKALARFEKSITIDSTNPYGYFYLAQAHYFLAHYQESLNFLDVAESLFTGQPYWLAEVFALRGENFRALGVVTRANSNYAEALRLNPGNLIAAEWVGKAETAVLPAQR